MAITSANQKHGNKISHFGNNICQKSKTIMAHFLVQLLINVLTPTTTSMAITSANKAKNISLMVRTSPSILKQQSNMVTTSVKQKT